MLQIHTKWVFNKKPGNIHKARLVARCDCDVQSIITYSETYLPTLRPEVARRILAQACHFKCITTNMISKLHTQKDYAPGNFKYTNKIWL
ncbi:hypothetical protein DAPK24_039150 [Pichia kluyveri]|uniref:Uncharacterized protein n=1 Tax=Pichia kluyveri TaxID=36015 RepID=A0AAV5R7P5_PICKL|nr:hypothetical protein DAPK24_039150 [Pichia kluyveri]